MQNLVSLEKGCSCSAHQGVYQIVEEERLLCDLMVLNGWSLKSGLGLDPFGTWHSQRRRNKGFLSDFLPSLILLQS